MIIGDNYGETNTETGEFRACCQTCGEWEEDCKCNLRDKFVKDKQNEGGRE